MEQECKFCCFKVRNPSDTANYLTLLLNGYNPEEIVGENKPTNDAEIKRQLCDMFSGNNITPIPEECKSEVKEGGKKRKRTTRKRRRKRKKRKSRKHRKRKTKHKRKHKKKHRRTRRR